MKRIVACIIFSILGSIQMNGQNVFGKWKTFNQENGNVNSIIKIYKDGDEVKGKVVRIIKEEDRDRVCENCDGEMKDKPIEGLVILRGLHKDGDEYTGGVVTDPKSGKEYKCKIWLDNENPDQLNIRGYIAFFYKTQTWERLD
ncbi:MAG: DUF2147 domain-containing protein, partial [Gillisia sp.]